MTAEEERLRAARAGAPWKKWGPYLSERAWGTVREDYSPDGSVWEYFTHAHSRSRAYRWNEDGLAGICDDRQYLCFALALWNGRDPFLKERLFGVTGSEGNHGEDVKECYFYLDSTPTHSYMRFLYKYPQAEFPYAQLLEENQARGRCGFEYELLDTGVFDEERYFDVQVEYAKGEPEEILVRIEVTNRGPERAAIHLLPTLWFRNTWSWNPLGGRPTLSSAAPRAIEADHPVLGPRRLTCEASGMGPSLLFTENETNFTRVFPAGGVSGAPYVKDSFHDHLIHGLPAVNPERTGTKAAAHYVLELKPGESRRVRLRLAPVDRVEGERERRRDGERLARGVAPSLLPSFSPSGSWKKLDDLVDRRRAEADAFFEALTPGVSEERRAIHRQAAAGLLWSKQFYAYEVESWLRGDPGQPQPPETRLQGRNCEWTHLTNSSVMLVPDKWEYPWYAAWDLAFQCVAVAEVDPDLAKEQLLLVLREWFMHPSGQLPACEWGFSDAHPPVHAWAAWQVYEAERRRTGKGDREFLQRVLHKLLLNFTWWVNRKDTHGRNIFHGGFLGLDNIGPFDRGAPVPGGGYLDQADGTGWMAMYCRDLLRISLELAREEHAYEELATKFLDHFFRIADAINGGAHRLESREIDLWDEEDGFYYDVLHRPGRAPEFLRVRSWVGLIPLFAVLVLNEDLLRELPDFRQHFEWLRNHRPEMCRSALDRCREGERLLLSIVDRERLRPILARLLDENEMLSPHGIRSLSRAHADEPYEVEVNGAVYRADYAPGDSMTGSFGGNSNWRGPVWFPLNYLLLQALEELGRFHGPELRFECPAGSGRERSLTEVAAELSRRLVSLFEAGAGGSRPAHGCREPFSTEQAWRDLILFYEYFHGDTGAGRGASHQTGWTALAACLIAR